MAFTPVQKPQYPDVPKASGVPSVFRDPTAPVFTVLLLVADVQTVLRLFEGPQWGVFSDGGAPIAIPDSVVSVDYRQEWRLSDYPLEQGGFESYDKVAVPYDARIRMSCDGTTTPRSLFLSQIQFAATSLDLFTIVTKDATYANASIVHYDYRRERNSGVGILQVDIWLEEVRVTVQTQFTNTKEPMGASSVNTGSVQPATPTSSQSVAVAPHSDASVPNAIF